MSTPRGTADIAGATPAPDEGARDERETAQEGAPAADTAGRAEDDRRIELVSGAEAERFRARWTEVQTRFVDGPQGAVEDADALVADVMRHLAQTFADERATQDRQWSEGDSASTEDQRVAMTRYRSFFDRLLEA
jgi:hypothetical protein